MPAGGGEGEGAPGGGAEWTPPSPTQSAKVRNGGRELGS